MFRPYLPVVAAAAILLFLLDPTDAFYCPAKRASDDIWYATDVVQLTNSGVCQTYFLDDNVAAATAISNGTTISSDVGIMGDFECDGDCHGFIMNPNYILWDTEKDDWKQLDTCSVTNSSGTYTVQSIPTCNDAEEDLQCDVFECGNGYYRCVQKTGNNCEGRVISPNVLSACPETITVATGVSGMDMLTFIFSEEGLREAKILGIRRDLYTVITHFRTCSGDLRFTYDHDGNHCPPSVVSSLVEEVEHYCMHGAIYTLDNTYSCEFESDDLERCEGMIDPNTIVPVCQFDEIQSCADQYYYESCTHEVGRNAHPDKEGRQFFVKHCAGNSFTCWDRHQNQWCQGKVVPTHGSFENPVCPSVVATCDSLEEFGINHQDCDCFDINGEGGFVCGEFDNPYCKGQVDNSATPDDAKLSEILLPATTSSQDPHANSHDADVGSAKEPDPFFDVAAPPSSLLSSNEKKPIIPLMATLGGLLLVVMLALVGYKRYQARKKSLDDSWRTEALELSLQSSWRHIDTLDDLEMTMHHDNKPNFRFIQHPRGLV